jgi:hypothetical protein
MIPPYLSKETPDEEPRCSCCGRYRPWGDSEEMCRSCEDDMRDMEHNRGRYGC